MHWAAAAELCLEWLQMECSQRWEDETRTQCCLKNFMAGVELQVAVKPLEWDSCKWRIWCVFYFLSFFIWDAERKIVGEIGFLSISWRPNCLQHSGLGQVKTGGIQVSCLRGDTRSAEMQTRGDPRPECSVEVGRLRERLEDIPRLPQVGRRPAGGPIFSLSWVGLQKWEWEEAENRLGAYRVCVWQSRVTDICQVHDYFRFLFSLSFYLLPASSLNIPQYSVLYDI